MSNKSEFDIKKKQKQPTLHFCTVKVGKSSILKVRAMLQGFFLCLLFIGLLFGWVFFLPFFFFFFTHT